MDIVEIQSHKPERRRMRAGGRWSGSRCRSNSLVCRASRWHRIRLFRREVQNILQLAAIVDLEIALAEAADRSALRVPHHHAYHHQIALGLELEGCLHIMSGNLFGGLCLHSLDS